MTLPRWSAVALALWSGRAVAQQAESAAPSANAGVTVSVSGEASRDLQAKLDALRAQFATAQADATTLEHAVAVLLLHDKAELTSLVRVTSRRADRGIQGATIDVYARDDGDIVGVVIELVNPRSFDPWNAADAVTAIVRQPWSSPKEHELQRNLLPIRAAALRLAHPDAPAWKQRIAVAFNVERSPEGGPLDGGPVTVEIQRAGRWEFEFDLTSADLTPPTRRARASLAPTDCYRVPRPRVVVLPAVDRNAR